MNFEVHGHLKYLCKEFVLRACIMIYDVWNFLKFGMDNLHYAEVVIWSFLIAHICLYKYFGLQEMLINIIIFWYKYVIK